MIAVFGDKPIVIFRIMARKKTTENIQAKNNNNNASSSGVKKKRKSDTTSETLTKKLKAKKDEKASGVFVRLLSIICAYVMNALARFCN